MFLLTKGGGVVLILLYLGHWEVFLGIIAFARFPSPKIFTMPVFWDSFMTCEWLAHADLWVWAPGSHPTVALFGQRERDFLPTSPQGYPGWFRN